MLHVIPIICLLMFFGFVEFRLSREILKIEKEIRYIKKFMNNEDCSNQ